MRWLAASVICGSVAVATPAEATLVTDDPCLGRWQGVGKNTGHPQLWTIDLTLTSQPGGGVCGTIEYTNPRCGGVLEGCERKGAEIHTRERYTHSDGCAPPGQVIIRCDGDKLHYSWLGWERVDSDLARVGERPSAPRPAPTPSLAEPPSPPSDEPSQPVSRDEPTRGCAPGCGIAPTPPGASWLVLFSLVALRRKSSR
jgi:hypothetical protein